MTITATRPPKSRFGLRRIGARRLRNQIIIPYLLLATVLAVSGTYYLINQTAQQRQADFNGALLAALRAGATSLADVERQQVAGLRTIVYTQGIPEALDELSRQATDPAALATLAAQVGAVARNSGFDTVGVVLSGTTTLLLLPAPVVPPPADDATVRALVSYALQPVGTLDKVSGLDTAASMPVFLSAGPVRLGGRIVGAVLVGTKLQTVLQTVTQAGGHLDIGASFYTPAGVPLQPLAPGQTTVASWPPLDATVYGDVANAPPESPARTRRIRLAASQYLEALAPVPGHGLDGPPALFGVALNTQALDSQLLDGLLPLVALFGLSLLLVISIGRVLAARIDRPLAELVNAADRVAQGDLAVQVLVTREDELGVLAARFNEMVVGLRQLLFVKDLFGRFVSPEVSAQLLSGAIQLGGEQRHVTILFSDLREFTQLSEEHPPAAIVELLNEYFRAVVEAAAAQGGIVNKFGGDSTLIVFGAPVALPDHAERALATALALRAALTAINAHRVPEGWAALHQGIGISTGLVVAGQIGAESRMEYTVIGDPVNLAARLQELSKTFNGDIFVSSYTWAALQQPSDWIWQDQGQLGVRGKQEQVQVYRLLDQAVAAVTEQAAAVVALSPAGATRTLHEESA